MKPNVDEHEIAKFSAVAENWWNLDGEFKPLHQLNPLRLDYIQQHTHGLFGKKVLDVGCGGGILAESMAKAGANVTGLDMAPASLAVARHHALENKVDVTYIEATVEAHALEQPEQYDVVTCMEMLEHVPDPASIIQSCAKLVKPNGHLFFSTINRNAKAWLMMIVGAEYIVKIVPKGTHDANKFIRPSELISWLNDASLTEQHMTGVRYNPCSGTFKLSPKVDVNYMIYCKK